MRTSNSHDEREMKAIVVKFYLFRRRHVQEMLVTKLIIHVVVL